MTIIENITVKRMDRWIMMMKLIGTYIHGELAGYDGLMVNACDMMDDTTLR